MQKRLQHLIFFFIILLYAFIPKISFEQTNQRKISGIVSDSQTGEPLFNVNIFLANTTTGGASGEDGRFIIHNVPQGGFDLVVSRIGYEIKVVPVKLIEQKNYQFTFKLKPKPIKGEEVQVEAPEPKQWKKDLKKFELLFLGESENRAECKILNPYVLNFFDDRHSGRFYAFTDSTVKVENNALGYLLNIVFHRFEYTGTKLIYGVYARYEELPGKSDRERKKWENSRKNTYLGSFRHFVKSAVRGEIEKNGFVVYDVFSLDRTGAWKRYAPNEMNFVAIDSATSIGKFHFNNYLGVSYTGYPDLNSEPIESILELNEPFAEVDSLGNILTGYSITIRGDWTKGRFSNMLPLDYKPEK